MENELVCLIKEFERGDDIRFLQIVEKMNPLIHKYERLLFKDDREDVREELILALLESIRKMKYCDNEGQAVYFLSISLKNKFHELYNKSKKQYDNETSISDEVWEQIPSWERAYDNVNLKQDFEKILYGLNKVTQSILYAVLVEGESDSNTAKENNVSRQYVHRLKKLYYQILKDKYYI